MGGNDQPTEQEKNHKSYQAEYDPKEKKKGNENVHGTKRGGPGKGTTYEQ